MQKKVPSSEVRKHLQRRKVRSFSNPLLSSPHLPIARSLARQRLSLGHLHLPLNQGTRSQQNICRMHKMPFCLRMTPGIRRRPRRRPARALPAHSVQASGPHKCPRGC